LLCIKLKKNALNRPENTLKFSFVKFAKEKSRTVQEKEERKRSIGKTMPAKELKERKINCDD